jgi:hypothetical protein
MAQGFCPAVARQWPGFVLGLIVHRLLNPLAAELSVARENSAALAKKSYMQPVFKSSI